MGETRTTDEDGSKQTPPLPQFKHEDVGLLLSRAWDDDLRPGEAQWLAEHLRQCEECSTASKRFVSFLLRLEDQLGKSPE